MSSSDDSDYDQPSLNKKKLKSIRKKELNLVPSYVIKSSSLYLNNIITSLTLQPVNDGIKWAENNRLAICTYQYIIIIDFNMTIEKSHYLNKKYILIKDLYPDDKNGKFISISWSGMDSSNNCLLSTVTSNNECFVWFSNSSKFNVLNSYQSKINVSKYIDKDINITYFKDTTLYIGTKCGSIFTIDFNNIDLSISNPKISFKSFAISSTSITSINVASNIVICGDKTGNVFIKLNYIGDFTLLNSYHDNISCVSYTCLNPNSKSLDVFWAVGNSVFCCNINKISDNRIFASYDNSDLVTCISLINETSISYSTFGGKVVTISFIDNKFQVIENQSALDLVKNSHKFSGFGISNHNLIAFVLPNMKKLTKGIECELFLYPLNNDIDDVFKSNSNIFAAQFKIIADKNRPFNDYLNLVHTMLHEFFSIELTDAKGIIHHMYQNKHLLLKCLLILKTYTQLQNTITLSNEQAKFLSTNLKMIDEISRCCVAVHYLNQLLLGLASTAALLLLKDKISLNIQSYELSLKPKVLLENFIEYQVPSILISATSSENILKSSSDANQLINKCQFCNFTVSTNICEICDSPQFN